MLKWPRRSRHVTRRLRAIEGIVRRHLARMRLVTVTRIIVEVARPVAVFVPCHAGGNRMLSVHCRVSVMPPPGARRNGTSSVVEVRATVSARVAIVARRTPVDDSGRIVGRSGPRVERAGRRRRRHVRVTVDVVHGRRLDTGRAFGHGAARVPLPPHGVLRRRERVVASREAGRLRRVGVADRGGRRLHGNASRQLLQLHQAVGRRRRRRINRGHVAAARLNRRRRTREGLVHLAGKGAHRSGGGFGHGRRTLLLYHARHERVLLRSGSDRFAASRVTWPAAAASNLLDADTGRRQVVWGWLSLSDLLLSHSLVRLRAEQGGLLHCLLLGWSSLARDAHAGRGGPIAAVAWKRTNGVVALALNFDRSINPSLQQTTVHWYWAGLQSVNQKTNFQTFWQKLPKTSYINVWWIFVSHRKLCREQSKGATKPYLFFRCVSLFR